MRTLPKIGQERLIELQEAWKQKHSEEKRRRLQVIRLIARHEHSAQEIAEIVDIGRRSVFRYLKIFLEGGVSELLKRNYRGSTGKLDERLQAKLRSKLEAGAFIRGKDVLRWLRDENLEMSLSSVYYWLGKAGGVLKVPRKTHIRKDAAKVKQFRENLAENLLALSDEPEKTHLWVADEHRYGLIPVIRRCWGLPGKRVFAPYVTRYEWGYLYEALEVDGQHHSEFLFVPGVDKDISKLFLQQIAECDPDKTHIVIWDGAGFHPTDGEDGVPENVRLLKLPPYSPELNPVEHLGDMIKDAVCNQVFSDLRSLEEQILKEIDRFRHDEQCVAGLIHYWLQNQANAIAQN